MSDSDPITTDPWPTGLSVVPLTLSSKTDGRPYKRFDDIEEQISSVIKNPPPSWAPEQLKSETIVYLVRRLQSANDLENLGRLILCLGRRVARIARDFTRGMNQSTAEDFVDQVAFKITEYIFQLSPTGRGERLECTFRKVVRCVAINERDFLKNRRKHEVAESALPASSSKDADASVMQTKESDLSSPEDELIEAEDERLRPERIRKALAGITDERHREAIVLRYLHGWPIQSTDPSIPTLMSRFSKSAEQIRNWIKTAKSEMRSALGEKL